MISGVSLGAVHCDGNKFHRVGKSKLLIGSIPCMVMASHTIDCNDDSNHYNDMC